jgi:hypothetical protein
MAFEVHPYPEFSWSQSRRSTFRECPRKYFWTYYGSHNGWLREAPAEARAAWRLTHPNEPGVAAVPAARGVGA